MPKISAIIHTASYDNFLADQGLDSYFQSVIECLQYQNLKDFELVYVDTFYDLNKDKFSPLVAAAPFQIKHVPLHPNHKYWYNQGYTYIAAAKNTGILYADGELLISFDDAEFFPHELFEKYWGHYQDGYLMHAFHRRMKNIKTSNGQFCYPIEGEVYVNDGRAPGRDLEYHDHGSWTYAGTSFPLLDIIKLNGVNERMDGNKSLEDCDLGSRLVLLGRKLVLDKTGFVYILDHKSYVDSGKRINEFIAVENHGMYRCGVELLEAVANKNPISKQHVDIIRRETLKYRGFDPFDAAHKPNTDIWLATPTFDIAAERKELRQSNNWSW